jgi:hypothetical protein
MRILFAALLCLPSFAHASGAGCVTIKSSGSEVCKAYGGAGIDITYRGSLVQQAEHAVYAVGNINGVEFKAFLQAFEPMPGEKIGAYVQVDAKQKGPLDVTLTFVNDVGTTDDSNGERFFHFD